MSFPLCSSPYRDAKSAGTSRPTAGLCWGSHLGVFCSLRLHFISKRGVFSNSARFFYLFLLKLFLFFLL